MKPANHASPAARINPALSRRTRIILCLGIFLLAFGVRVLTWHDTRLEVGKVQTAVTGDYQRIAQLLRQGGPVSFFSSSSPLADLNNLGHPPGYSILLALIYTGFGQSNTAVQFVQIGGDALAAVLIFLIVAELFSLSAGAIAGTLAALSPQLAWNSVLLLPDSLSVLPILLAVYLLTRAVKHPRTLTFAGAGVLVGISCWLRPNAMLLTFFLAAAVPLLIGSERQSASNTLANRDPKWRFALALVCGTLLMVLPLTIRNAIVFHRFIPLSLGAGQTLLEGIADYDPQERFGIPRTDIGVMKQEAEIYQRADYYGTLFNPDGVERERARLSRGFAVIRSHPVWFAGVMARRASTMLRLERSRQVSTEPAITHSLDPNSESVSALHPDDLAKGISPRPADARVEPEGNGVLRIVGNNSRYGMQAGWTLTVQPNTDYLLQTAVKLESGRIRISIVGANSRSLTSTVVDTQETFRPEDQPYTPVALGFVADTDHPRMIISNEASNAPAPVIKVGAIRVNNLGPARFLWTRYPRFILHGLQKIFLTAVILPIAIAGLAILILRKQSRALVILSLVPVYFFTVQSVMHTEYRYVLAVNYFLFALAAIGMSWAGSLLIEKFRSRWRVAR